MARDWETTFNFWGSPPSNTEQQKCANAETAIRKAITSSTALNQRTISVFVQGSYANGTNVRQDSDVDVCVLYKDAFFEDYSISEGLNRSVLNITEADYPYSEFKNDVEKALVSYFGRDAVRRGKKALDIRENSYRVDADVVPCFEHRLYEGNQWNHSYRSGTQLFPDNGGKIVNWPKQNYDNGVTKNALTNRNFKAVTRILKNLRFELIDEKVKIAESIPSFLLECLVWNVPNANLLYGTHRQNVRATLAYLWNETRTDDQCRQWTEVNDIKFLFRLSQPWTRANVNTFLQTAWDYIGFE